MSHIKGAWPKLYDAYSCNFTHNSKITHNCGIFFTM